MAKARAKKDGPVKKELPSLFCHLCRDWVDTQVKHNMFDSIDGVKQTVKVWACGRHKGA